MKQLFLILTVSFLFGCVNQGDGVSVSQEQAKSVPSKSPTPTPYPEDIDSELESQLAKIAEPAKGRVGIGAVFVETKQAAYLGRDGHHPMQSVYKLPIAMKVLQLIDEGKVRLDQDVNITPDDFVRVGFYSPIRSNNPNGVVMQVGEILRRSVSESDGTASDVLLDLAGGPPQVMSYLESIGVRDVIVADSEKSISKDWVTQYRNWATPISSIVLLRKIHERTARLSEQTTVLLLNLMTEGKTGNQRLKAGIPEGIPLAHKTGTGGTEGGITGATNDIGIITLPDGRHILIAVYVSDSPANDGVRQKVIADAAKTVLARWAPGISPGKKPALNGSNFNTTRSPR
ncbi:MAG TPA: class A beta-lactamase [Pyrinomonadaceae bacterium]|nr:class A beta-lactamase [Pyrinomonadaceae bacterium]